MPRAHQVATRRQGTLKGAYVAKKEEGDLELIILAAGSEVQHAISAADSLGKGVRVVSVPSMYRFDKQSAEYKEEVLPSSCTKRVAMEVRVCVPCFCVVGLRLVRCATASFVYMGYLFGRFAWCFFILVSTMVIRVLSPTGPRDRGGIYLVSSLR